MIPKFYHSDRLRLGTLSGQFSSVTNPVRRIADGSITLSYIATSGATPTGTFETRITSGQGSAENPTHFVIARGTPSVSGYRVIVTSEDLDGTNSATRLDVTLTSGVTYTVQALSGGVARRVWRVLLSGTGSTIPPLRLFEAMLADEYQPARQHQVGVRRQRVRQFTRIELPGTQAFVKRDGPRLLATSYALILVSGSEIDGLHTFLDAIEGGEPVFHTDDLGQNYFAEVMGTGPEEEDEAGVYSLDLQVQEIGVD